LHDCIHNISGMMGSLDVTKGHWKHCLTAWTGQFEGHEKFSRIGLEAVVDTNLWFLHASFGFLGTLNIINTWEHSSLFESMTNVEHDELVFDFPVELEVFSKLHYLVDGIYPQLSHFLSSESNPHSKLAFSFAGR